MDKKKLIYQNLIIKMYIVSGIV